MLITSKLNIKIVPLNIKRLSLIYNNIKLYDIVEINVNELSKNSPIEITCSCELCGSIRKLQYRKYCINRNRYGYYSCKKCKNKKTNITKEIKYGDPYYNNASKMIKTKEELGIYIPLSMSNDFKIYRKVVNRFTYKSKKKLYENWNGYDYYDNEFIKENLKLKSKDMLYPTVDHIISLHEGFTNNIVPYLIGNLDNLCITKRSINLLKSNKINFNLS